MRKIAVTGSAGFIGSSFVDYAVDRGHAVTGIDDLSFGNRRNISEKAKFTLLDVRNYGDLRKWLCSEKPDAIAHFAADATTKSSSLGWSDPMKDYAVNMVGTLNILEIMRRELPDARLVYASSAAVYGEPERLPIRESDATDPVSPYGVSKLAGEKYCHAYAKAFGLQTTVMRIFNTYGPRQSRYVMFDQIRNILAHEDKIEILGTGGQLRDYAYIDDTVDAFYRAMMSPESAGGTFNVAGGRSISIRDLIGVLKRALGRNPEERYTGESWKGDIQSLWADTSRIRLELGWEPAVTLEQGIDRFIRWLALHEED